MRRFLAAVVVSTVLATTGSIIGASPAGAQYSPPPVTIQILNPIGYFAGRINVYYRQPIYLRITGCPNGTGTAKLHFSAPGGPLYRTSVLTESPVGSGVYTGYLYPLFHGYGGVTADIVCPGGVLTTAGLPIYLDPSGTVVDTNGNPIPDAAVTLLQDGQPVPDGSDIMSLDNRSNPSMTDASGAFNWDTVAGTYSVRAQKAGCSDPADHSKATVESPTFPVPPPKTGIVLVMYCGENTTNTSNTTGSLPVTGANIDLLRTLAAGLITAGALLVVLSRRRTPRGAV